jgi:hypothetical protein
LNESDRTLELGQLVQAKKDMYKAELRTREAAEKEVFTHLYECSYIYIHICMHIHIHVRTHIHIHIFIYIYTYKYS